MIAKGERITARLRILETTDLHMQILEYDYFADQPHPGIGLLHLSQTITALRSDPKVTTLLCDNGDFLQGNPLADYVAENPDISGANPMISAMNALGYDAITLGNHEFNYGLPYLDTVLRQVQAPVICANAAYTSGDTLVPPFAILERMVTSNQGHLHRLKIGVVGFLPPQITVWDKTALDGQIMTEDIILSARRVLPQIKAAGADIVVALCHSGIGSDTHVEGMENAAVPLAALPEIDVVLTGHTHDMFPDPTIPPTRHVDPTTGRLHGKPAVMAGFYGTSLGVIDLTLARQNDKWAIRDQSVRLEAGRDTEEDSSDIATQIKRDVLPAHVATLDHIRQPVADTRQRIHSYFASIGYDKSQMLLARAQQNFMEKALRQTAYANIPILSATSPFRAGGRAGVAHYIDVAPGPVALRDAVAIYPFSNTLCAVRQTGANIRAWLEKSGKRFAQMQPEEPDQQLINPLIPAYDHDSLYGLSYRYDLSRPSGRVRDLQYQGKPVADDDIFIVAANSYRANGGGGFLPQGGTDTIYSTTGTTRDILVDYLRQHGTEDVTETQIWSFVPLANVSALFLSAPAAQEHLVDGVTYLGAGPDGFALFRYTF